MVQALFVRNRGAEVLRSECYNVYSGCQDLLWEASSWDLCKELFSKVIEEFWLLEGAELMLKTLEAINTCNTVLKP